MSIKFNIKSFYKNLKAKFFYIININDTPHKIAGGFALGVFVGIFPTFWLGGLITLFLCWVLRLNYLAGIGGSFIIMNPFTTPIFWFLSVWLGALIFGRDVNSLIDIIGKNRLVFSIREISLIYLTGNFIVSVFFAIISYIVVLFFIKIYHKSKKIK